MPISNRDKTDTTVTVMVIPRECLQARMERKTISVTGMSFNGVGVAAATTGLVHPVFAMLAMVLSVSAVLANSFAGQLLSGEGVNTKFALDERTDGEREDGRAAAD